MGFSTRAEHYFRTAARHGGARYVSQGRVDLVEASNGRIHAVIDGDEDDVILDWSDGETIRAACTCSRFGGGLRLCKHIWAVGVAADSRGLTAS